MDSITMPEAMAQELRKNGSEKKQKNRTVRYPKIAAAVIAGALILSVGTTSYAVYQAKNLRVTRQPADRHQTEIHPAI